MSILLQHARTKMFFRYGSVWASNPEMAYDFRTAQAVFDFVQKENLQEVQLVVRLHNPVRYEVVPFERPAVAAPQHARV